MPQDQILLFRNEKPAAILANKSRRRLEYDQPESSRSRALQYKNPVLHFNCSTVITLG
jgi:hypothetical protein